MMAWIVLWVGAVSAYLSIRHLMARNKVEEEGDTTRYRQGLGVWALEVAWLVLSWVMVFVGLLLMFMAKNGH